MQVGIWAHFELAVIFMCQEGLGFESELARFGPIWRSGRGGVNPVSKMVLGIPTKAKCMGRHFRTCGNMWTKGERGLGSDMVIIRPRGFARKGKIYLGICPLGSRKKT